MFKKNIVSSAVLTTFMLSASAQVTAAVLTFDDLFANSQKSIVPEGYGGFDWNNATQVGVIANTVYPSSGYAHGTVSGANTAYNWVGHSPIYIDWMGTGTFNFKGAYWTSVWQDQNLTFKGFTNSSLLYSSNSYAINSQTPLWIELNWVGIDRLVIANTGSQWAMDNFTFDTQPVPEPATLALMGLGLAGVGFARRRRS